ncbi:MAG: PTS system, beta-glucoside-specific IIABC component [Shouchella clausii]|jgi:beta-glucoside PTS system EIICBA component
MSSKKLAEDILRLVGGRENVSSLTHCATRLRFNLRDNKKANKEELEKLNILKVIESGGQFQVVVGPHVSSVYSEVTKLGNFGTDPDSVDGDVKEKSSLTSRILDTISGSFTPLIPAIVGSGLIKALLSVLTMLGLLTETSGTYHILSAASNAIFYFLPVLLAVTFALKIGANPYIAATIVAALLEPNFTGLLQSGDSSSFLGIPVVLMDYSSQILPVFGAIGLLALLEKLLKKIIMDQLHLIFVPMLSLLIIVPITVFVFGPFGIYVGDLIATGTSFILDKSAIITGLILGMTWVFIVILGLHWAILPIMISNITSTGSDPIMGLMMGTVWGAGGAALGVLLKTKDKNLKAVASSSLIPAFLSGVSEPIIYGIFFRYRRAFIIFIIMSGISCAVAGAFGITATQVAGGIFTIPTFSPVWAYLIVMAISIFGTALAVVIFGYENKNTKKVEAGASLTKEQSIVSPLTGTVKELSQVNDPAFSSETMGKGIAIVPTIGEVISPVSGEITTIFPTRHAIGITSDTGVEILIHIGLNTVELEGKYFATELKQGDQVKQGELLVSFDLEKIKEAGYDVITPIIITNSNSYKEIIKTNNEKVQANDVLLNLTI